MKSSFSLLRFALLLVVAMWMGAASWGQQKHRLRDVSAAGDHSINESDLRMDIAFQTTISGQKGPTFHLSSQRQEKYAETVLAADRRGRATVVRRTYEVARESETQSGGPSKQTVRSLQGKTVTIRRTGGKVRVEVAKGRMSAEDRKDLVDELSEDMEEFFPNRALAPGETWTIHSKQIARAFGGGGRGTVQGRFLDVVTQEGLRCARIQLTVDLSVRVSDTPLTMKMRLSGEGHHALDIQRPLSLSLTGPITAQGQEKEQGMTIDMTGQGTVRMTMKADWRKVGNKPVR